MTVDDLRKLLEPMRGTDLVVLFSTTGLANYSAAGGHVYTRFKQGSGYGRLVDDHEDEEGGVPCIVLWPED